MWLIVLGAASMVISGVLVTLAFVRVVASGFGKSQSSVAKMVLFPSARLGVEHPFWALVLPWMAWTVVAWGLSWGILRLVVMLLGRPT